MIIDLFTKYLFILKRFDSSRKGWLDLAAYKTQLEIKQEDRYHEVGKIIWSLFKYFFKMYTANHWCSSKLKSTPAQCFIGNYLQHPKNSYFSDVQNGVILTFKCTKLHSAHLTTCAKMHKKVKKLERKYYTNNICITDIVQIYNISIHYIVQLFFWKLELKFRD